MISLLWYFESVFECEVDVSNSLRFNNRQSDKLEFGYQEPLYDRGAIGRDAQQGAGRV